MRAPLWTVATLAWITVLGGACLAAAQASIQPAPTLVMSAGEPAAKDKAGKELHAIRITGAPPRIDGVFEDEVWRQAEAIADFVQEEPDNITPPTERTTIRLAYDDRYLYVAVQMLSANPADIRDGLGRRGSAPPSDSIQLGFDTTHDHTNAYCFEVNASGVQNDFALVEDTRTNNDYEAVWDVATTRTADGWNAEFRIPFSQMRFPMQPGARTVWGFNARRSVFARGETDWWIARPRGEQGQVSRYGHLVFADQLSPPRRIEMTPYTLGQLQTKSGSATTGGANGGFDLRLGLGSSANLSATVNPDFGQVEADPSVLNLSTVETFYPEKRPFFLEESQAVAIQSFGQFPDFYSRRIGATPNHFDLADSETLVTKPDHTTIVGAAKLTGRTAHVTYGALTATTSREYGVVDTSQPLADGTTAVHRGQKLIEPRTVYSAGRVQRTILGDTSSIGLDATSVVREKDADAFTGGGDWSLRRSRNRFFFNGHWVGTHAPIDGVVRNGLGGAMNMSYTAKYWNANVHVDHFGDNFHNSDLGFLGTRPNKNEVNAGVLLYQPDPKGILRNSQVNVYGDYQVNNQGLQFNSYYGANYNINFTNFWHVYVAMNHDVPRYDDLDTRGGPPIWAPGDTFTVLNFDSDSRKQWGIGWRSTLWRNTLGGYQVSGGPTVRVQPTQRLLGSIGIDYASALDSAQWIDNIDADGDGVDDNVYGTLRRHVLNVTARSTYSFTRDLTLEAYLQPFIAVGAYTGVRKLAHPRSFDFTPVSLADDPDFNRKSVRGTVVLRWEYIRGSTLFAVWNLSTSDELKRLGVFSPVRDLGGAFGAPGTNTFAIKLSYWFTP